MKVFWRMMLAILLGTGLVLGGFPAVYGQEEEEEKKEVFTLEEIIVTAQKREQELINVPMTVTAFTGDYMEQRGIDSFQDIVNQLPGVHLGYPEAGANTEQGSKVYFRGTAVSSAGKTASAPTSFYIDEVSLQFPNSPYSPPINAFFDVERVEVLYGPSGSLYGQGAFGGTIKVITKDVDLKSYGGKTQVEVSTTDHGGRANYSINTVLNAPVVKDRFGLRVIAGNTFRGSIGDLADPADGENINESDIAALRVKGLLKINDSLSIGASHWITRYTQDMYYGFWVDAPNFIIPTPLSEFPDNDSGTTISEVTIDWNLPFADLVSATGWVDGFQSQEVGYYYPTFEWALTGGEEKKGWSHETRLVSNQDSPLRWIAGVYYGEADLETIATGYSYYAEYDFAEPFDNNMLNESTMKAIFGEISYDLLDGDLTVLVGGRWYEEERHAVAKEFGALVGTVEKTFDDFTPRFNVAYYPAENGMVFLNVAKGTRSGLINLCDGDADDNPSNGCQNADLIAAGWSGDTQVIDSDSLWSYEIGTKWSLLDGSLTLMGSFYYSQWKDFQGEINFREIVYPDEEIWYEDPPGSDNWVFGIPPDISAQTASQFMNIGDLNLWGAQLQIAWRPTASLSIDWNGSWNTGEWDTLIQDPDKGIFTLAGAKEGDEIIGNAEWTSNLSVSYFTDIGNYSVFASATWSVDDLLTGFPEPSITYNTTSLRPDSYIPGVPSEAVDNREDISLNLGISRGRWSALLFVNNLLNKDEPISGGSSDDPSTAFVPHPFTIGLRVTVDFGSGSKSLTGMAGEPGGSIGK